jgi:hypothetical protein
MATAAIMASYAHAVARWRGQPWKGSRTGTPRAVTSWMLRVTQRQFVLHGGRREQAVDGRHGVGHVQGAPALRDASVDGKDALPVRLAQPSQPLVQRGGRGRVAAAQELDAAADLPGDEHARVQVLVGHAVEPGPDVPVRAILTRPGLAGPRSGTFEDLVAADPTPADGQLAVDQDPLEGGAAVRP